jgi:DeoR/GlpR family transcriptional regulator of sugar metabolism
MKPTKKELLPYSSDLKKAAKRFNKSERTIRRWLKEAKIYSPKENFGPGKLNQEQAVKIRNLDATGEYTQMELADMFEVTQATIGRVLNNIYYKTMLHITGNADAKWF